MKNEGKKTWKNHVAIYNTRIYKIWSNMMQRCSNKNNTHYGDYGGKGIRVITAWNDSKTFIKWSLENGYTEKLTIDRMDGNKNYEPSNCRWVSRKEQSQNIKSNRIIEINGIRNNVSSWSTISGINKNTLNKRLGLGWNHSDLLKPVDRRFSNAKSR